MIMRRNIFEIFTYAVHTILFHFKVAWFCRSISFAISKPSNISLAYGPFHIKGRVGKLRVGKRLRVLGSVSIIYSDDHLGELIVHDNVIIEDTATLAPRQGKIEIGTGCFIGPNVLIQAFAGSNVVIGDFTMIAKDAIILSSNHDISTPLLGYGPEVGDSINVGNNVWVGAGVKILAGVNVGSNSVIAAGAVVTKNVDSFCIYAGVPAKKIKAYDKSSLKWLPV